MALFFENVLLSDSGDARSAYEAQNDSFSTSAEC